MMILIKFIKFALVTVSFWKTMESISWLFSSVVQSTPIVKYKTEMVNSGTSNSSIKKITILINGSKWRFRSSSFSTCFIQMANFRCGLMLKKHSRGAAISEDMIYGTSFQKNSSNNFINSKRLPNGIQKFQLYFKTKLVVGKICHLIKLKIIPFMIQLQPEKL